MSLVCQVRAAAQCWPAVVWGHLLSRATNVFGDVRKRQCEGLPRTAFSYQLSALVLKPMETPQQTVTITG